MQSGKHEGETGAVAAVTLPAAARWALAGLALCMLLASLGTSIANVALPTLAQAFTASFQDVQWVVLAYLLAVTTLIVSVGRLGDIVGRRRLLLAGIGLFTAASLLCGLAPTLWLLIAARAVQGLGAAIMMALTVALVGETVPRARVGSAMGLLGTMSAVGTALGPSLGGFLIAGTGWRAIFFAALPLGLLTLLLAWRHLPADRGIAQSQQARFDRAGTVFLALTLAAYALAMTIGRGSFGVSNLALLAAAMVGGGLFVLVQTRTPSPLIQMATFRDGVMSASLFANVLVSTVMMATLVVGPFYLSGAIGLKAVAVGMVLSIGPVLSALSGVPAGRLVDRLGAPVMAIAGLSVMATGALALSLLPESFGLAGYIVAIAVLTPGYQLLQAANNTAVMAEVPSDQRGVVSGLLSLSRNLGLITGASVMGAVFSFASGMAGGVTGAGEAVATGMQVTFLVAAALAAAAIAIVAASRMATAGKAAGRAS